MLRPNGLSIWISEAAVAYSPKPRDLAVIVLDENLYLEPIRARRSSFGHALAEWHVISRLDPGLVTTRHPGSGQICGLPVILAGIRTAWRDPNFNQKFPRNKDDLVAVWRNGTTRIVVEKPGLVIKACRAAYRCGVCVGTAVEAWSESKAIPVAAAIISAIVTEWGKMGSQNAQNGVRKMGSD